ncbi:MAG: OB-fold nucleic acid binding domain-containing protein, partial [Janthinobacterium lividum]
MTDPKSASSPAVSTSAVPPAPEVEQSAILRERRQKLEAMRADGPAYPNDFRPDTHAAALRAQYGEADKEALEAQPVPVRIAGRMILKRVMGRASFATIQDDGAAIQLFITPADAGDASYEAFKKWDLGDIVGAEGTLFRTNKGELS